MTQTQRAPVSVIIPAYKVTAYIAQALDSALAQTLPPTEIIVVNDGCPDSDNLERTLAPYRDRIIYLTQTNQGAAAARNAGIRRACSPLIATLDGDDYWRPDYLEVQQKHLFGDPSIDVISCDAVILGDTALAGHLWSRYSPSNGPVTFSSLVTQKCTIFTSVLARKQAIEKVGCYDETLRRCEDFDLWVRLVKAGGRIVYHQEPLVFYRVRPDGLTANRLACINQLIFLLERYINQLPLAETEIRDARGARLEWFAHRHLDEAKAALHRGEYADSVRALSAANQVFSSFKLGATLRALKVAPGLVRRAHRMLRPSEVPSPMEASSKVQPQ